MTTSLRSSITSLGEFLLPQVSISFYHGTKFRLPDCHIFCGEGAEQLTIFFSLFDAPQMQTRPVRISWIMSALPPSSFTLPMTPESRAVTWSLISQISRNRGARPSRLTSITRVKAWKPYRTRCFAMNGTMPRRTTCGLMNTPRTLSRLVS